MKELRLKRLTRARMEQWLRENPDAEFNIKNSTSCPVACFIMSEYMGVKSCSVGLIEGCITPQKSLWATRRFHLPTWAREFIARVDRLSNYSIKINGAQALSILTSF